MHKIDFYNFTVYELKIVKKIHTFIYLLLCSIIQVDLWKKVLNKFHICNNFAIQITKMIFWYTSSLVFLLERNSNRDMYLHTEKLLVEGSSPFQ